MITHFFEVTLRFEREKKAGLGLRRRVPPAFLALRGASPCRNFYQSFTNLWVKFSCKPPVFNADNETGGPT